MTCKHNWHFLEGLSKRIRCIKCAAVEFVNKKDAWSLAPDSKYSITSANTNPTSISFRDGGSKEVMRISNEGVTTNPEFPVDEGAKYVIKALDTYVRAMAQKEYERGVTAGKATTEDSSVAQRPRTWKADRSGKYLTIVYRDVDIGDEVTALTGHPKSCAMSWSHALWDVDYLKGQA